MRLAYLSGSQVPSRFANSVHVVKMCRALVDIGWSVTLHGRQGEVVDGGDPLASYGIDPVFDLALSAPPTGRVVQSLSLAIATRRQIAAARPDLLYARHVWSLAATARLGIPFIYEAHALPPTGMQRAAESWLLRQPNFRRLVVISAALRNDYLALFPWLNAANVLVAHDGADLVPMLQAMDIAPSLPAARPSALQVGYVGHLYPGKGMEIVAELAPLLRDVDFHVVGGTTADLARWTSSVTHSNLHFHGFVPHAELSTYYRAFDVVVVPVQRRVALQGGKGEIGRWTSPLKLFEAMAWGKALVVSDHPTLLEVVSHERDALVVPAASAVAWAEAIRRLALDTSLRARLGDAARRTLESEYTWRQRARSVTQGLAA